MRDVSVTLVQNQICGPMHENEKHTHKGTRRVFIRVFAWILVLTVDLFHLFSQSPCDHPKRLREVAPLVYNHRFAPKRHFDPKLALFASGRREKRLVIQPATEKL